MLFFRRLFNFKSGSLSRLHEKRKATRYAIGVTFPLKASVHLSGRERADAEATSRGCSWGGQLADFSSNGVSLLLPSAAVTFRGESTVLKLRLEEYGLDVPCTVAHFRVNSSHAVAGLSLAFADELAHKGYLQLLESVVMGASLEPVKASGKKLPGFVHEQYRSENDALLTAWRTAKGPKNLAAFELLIGDFCVRGESTSPELSVFTRAREPQASRVALTAPKFGYSGAANAEVRRLIRWIAPNISETVPLDVRQLVTKCAGN